MRKTVLMILMLSLALTACGGDGGNREEGQLHSSLEQAIGNLEQSFPEVTEATEASEDPGQEPTDLLAGSWMLESVEIGGEQLSAEAEGIRSTLTLYYDGSGQFCADYTYWAQNQPEGERVMAAMPVYHYAPEAEESRFLAWIDCSGYPYVFEQTEGEEYDLWLDGQGNLCMRFVSYTGGDYGVYSCVYTYVPAK